MTDIRQGFAFRAVGTITRIFIPPSNKVAFVTLEVHDGERSRKHELRCFDAAAMSQLSSAGQGSLVTLTGSIDCEPHKDKAKQDVTVDGRTLWIEKPTIRTVKVERAASKPPGPDLGDEDDPANGLAF